MSRHQTLARASIVVVIRRPLHMGPTADWQQPALRAARDEICSLPTECQGKRRGLQSKSMGVHFIQACLESHAALLAVSRIIGDLVMVDSPPSLKELAETSAALRAPGYQVVQAHRA